MEVRASREVLGHKPSQSCFIHLPLFVNQGKAAFQFSVTFVIYSQRIYLLNYIGNSFVA